MKKLRSFFSTPAKAVLSVLCLIVLLALLGAGIFLTAGFFAKRSAIGAEQARNLAFADAGVDPSAAKAVHTEFEFENGHFAYKVEFLAENIEYEYLLKASNGKILERDIESLGGPLTRKPADPSPIPADNPTFDSSTTSDPVTQTEPTVSDRIPQDSSVVSDRKTQTEPVASDPNFSGQISLETARQTALSDAGLKDSDVTQKKAELDYDDRSPVYEIEFYTATHDYEYEIDAVSGEIRHKEQEVLYAVENKRHAHGGTAAASPAESSDIGLEAAKSIAADHAGLSVSDIFFTKTERDFEDGYLVYELEFLEGRMEYEYEIDAVSGEILKFDFDHDD